MESIFLGFQQTCSLAIKICKKKKHGQISRKLRVVTENGTNDGATENASEERGKSRS